MLRSREKAVLVGGGIAAAAILLLTVLVIPGVARVRSLSNSFAAAERDLLEVRKMRPELTRLDREVRQRMAGIKAQANPSESPLARLTALIQEAGIPQASFSLKSGGTKDGEFVREETFDLRVENVTYLEAARLLTRLENGPVPLVIRSAQLKARYDDNKYIDATLRIGVLLPAGG